jgi:DNA transposition AAA+ family ATPase
MSGHFLDLKGAAIVATEQLIDARAMIGEAVEAQAMVAIHGAAGTGKSFAVEQALVDLPPRSWLWMDFRCRPTLRDVRHALHRATGLGSILPADAYGVDMALKAALAARPRLVVIDESQWLNRECFEYLRHLHDDPDTQFSLLFVGGAGCYEVLRREPMLDSRLYAHIRFEPLSLDQVFAVISVYHPIYAGVSDDVVAQIDRRCAHGNFRNWAKFTHHAARFCAESGREVIDDAVIRNVYRGLGGGMGGGQ